MDPRYQDKQPPAEQVLVIDDQPIVREALGRAIAGLGFGMVEAESLHDAARCLAEQPGLRLAIVDVALAGADGLRAVGRLLEVQPALPLLVLSAQDDPATARGALEAGARGFISKRSPIAVLVEVIRLILLGETYLPPQAVGARDGWTHVSRVGRMIATAPPQNEPPVQLTARQRDVLALLLRGRPNKMICRTLNLCEGTVKTHIASIFRNLGVNNRTEAAYAVRRLGIELPEVDVRAARFDPRLRPALSLVV
jgi:DNA-binding NarL/FixJ family response regulator